MSIITLLFSPIQQPGKISAHNDKKGTAHHRGPCPDCNIFPVRPAIQIKSCKPTKPEPTTAYLSLLIRSRLYSRILTELGRTSRLSERFYSERISRTLCKPLDSKRKRGVVLCGSKHRPFSALVLLDMVWMLTAYLSVAAFISVYSLNSVVLPVLLNDFILKE